MKIIKQMSDKLVIQELSELTEFKAAYPFVRQLRQTLSQAAYLDFVQKIPGYRAFVIVNQGKIISYAGFAEQINMYEGKHLFIYELLTNEAHRDLGYGKLLVETIEQEGKARGCQMLVLTSGLARKEAHRFYLEKMGMTQSSLVFRKDL